ncbi:MAG: circadian clock KaiB family protein [Pseudomonadota bacterium]
MTPTDRAPDPEPAPSVAPSVNPLHGPHVFRLYISAVTPVSSRALVNARRFFDEQLPGRYALEILNIADNVDLARQDQVIASPTLIRLSPLPQRRFIGDLSNIDRLFDMLQLAPPPSP